MLSLLAAGGLASRFAAGQDTGLVPPDTGLVPPDTGLVPPDTGLVPPDTGLMPPDGVFVTTQKTTKTDSHASTEPETKKCLACHYNPNVAQGVDAYIRGGELKAGPDELKEERPADYGQKIVVNPVKYSASAHGQMECVECHKAIDQVPHFQYVPDVKCEDCHPVEVTRYNEGMHALAFNAEIPDAPDCNNCHGSYHELLPSTNPLSVIYPLNGIDLCARCHANPDVLENHPDLKKDAVSSYWDTIHGHGMKEAGLMVAASCSSCHDQHRNLSVDDEASSMNVYNIAATCGNCHQTVEKTFRGSYHATELYKDTTTTATAPSCTGCHPGHGVIQTHTTKFQLQSVKDCSTAECHPDNLKTYLHSYHGKAWRFNGLDTARCATCHGYHDLHEPTSTSSTVHPSRLVETCGQSEQCHPYANDKFVLFMPHVHHDDPSHPQTYYTWLFMTFLLIGTMGFFALHTILWFFRGLIDLPRRRRAAKAAGEKATTYVRRFNLTHRITHAILFISVIGLALTGFPLRYPEHDWAHFIFKWLGGVKVAGGLHRVFAALTILYAGIHFIYLWKVWWRSPRTPFFKRVFGPNSLIPNLTDVKQFFQHVGWFLFIGKHPKFGRWTYWDKFDYWAVFWGVTIIGASGVIMAFSDFFGPRVPGWFFNVALIIHSDEALLAASFLFAIHFFHVHLRPDKFPMDHVMFTGSMTHEEMEEERAAELEQIKADGRLDEIRVAAPDPTQLTANRLIGLVALVIGLGLLACLFWTEIISSGIVSEILARFR